MTPGDRVTFHNVIGGSNGVTRDGEECTITDSNTVGLIVRFDDGFQMLATTDELVAL